MSNQNLPESQSVATELESLSVTEELNPPELKESGQLTFEDLPLGDAVQEGIRKVGYTEPTSIQAQIIPHLLEGKDVLAQSQTGSGKTAAFALPILSRLNTKQRTPQVLVLAPTRELAIQVAKSFSTYGTGLNKIKVATIYGGQSYDPQLRQLRAGAQVVVGTPGRVIDHINRGTLDISQINCLVLDEADEMLNMGFLEDVQFVLEKTPADRQIALFSATLPAPIQTVASQYLTDPVKIKIEQKTMTADSIRQRALITAPRDRVYALCRFLEAEETDGVIVFTKTKAATLVVAESLCEEKLSAVALNGDMPQATRERTIQQFKSGRIDVLVATDVAARGLDVSRVSHVFNFDLPHDAESYTHRIGRTGRAGRKGEAILFLTNSQRGKLRSIEHVTKQRIEVVQMPSVKQINALRIKRFKQQITDVAATDDLTMFKELIAGYAEESGKSIEMIAAALAHLSQQGKPFLAKERPKRERSERQSRGESNRSYESGDGRRSEGGRKKRQLGPTKPGMDRFRIEVGRRDGVEPRNIVGAIANEAGLEGEFIGPIHIQDAFTFVDLPEGMPKEIYQSLRKTRVVGKKMLLSLVDEASVESGTRSFGRRNDRNGRKPIGKQTGGHKARNTGKAKPFTKGKKRHKSSTNASTSS